MIPSLSSLLVASLVANCPNPTAVVKEDDYHRIKGLLRHQSVTHRYVENGNNVLRVVFDEKMDDVTLSINQRVLQRYGGVQCELKPIEKIQG